MCCGKQTWVFPDAELPPEGVNAIPGHESIIIVNANEKRANIQVTLFYTDRGPECFQTAVAARRVRCIRTNRKEDFGELVPKIGEQYAILLESDVPIVAQYGRAEPRAVNFYTTPGYSE